MTPTLSPEEIAALSPLATQFPARESDRSEQCLAESMGADVLCGLAPLSSVDTIVIDAAADSTSEALPLASSLEADPAFQSAAAE